jgi:hypothetical protein
MPDNDLIKFIQMISQLSPGSSPNDQFGVQTNPLEPGRLGMSDQSRMMSGALGQLQEAGARPPMLQQFPYGNSTAIFELLRAIMGMQNPQDPHYRAGPLEGTPPEMRQGGTVGSSRPLLQKLLTE